MDWRALLHNKWALGGLGAAAAVGGVVWWRRRSSGGGSSAGAGAQASPSYAPGGVGVFDSTGTDVANWLGSQSGMLQTQLDQYHQQLTDALSGLSTVPTSPAPVTPATAPTPTPAPPGPTSTPQYVTVAKYTSTSPLWNSTLSGIASHTHTTLSTLLRLNPSITNPDVIHTGQQIRVS